MAKKPWASIGWRVAGPTAALVLVAAAFCIYLARLPIAGWAIEHYLAAQGVESEVTVLSLSPTQIAATARIGAARHPDLTVERLAIQFAWHGLKPLISNIEIEAPVLRISYRQGTVSLGALDALSRSFSEGARQKRFLLSNLPDLSFTDAHLVLATLGGLLRIYGRGAIKKGQVTDLVLAAQPSRIGGAGFSASLFSATLRAADDRVVLSAAGALDAQVGITRVSTGRTSIIVREQGASLADLVAVKPSTVRMQAGILSDRISLPAVTLEPAEINLSATSRMAPGRPHAIALSLDGHVTVHRKDADRLLAMLPIGRDRRLASAPRGMMSGIDVSVPGAQLAFLDTIRLSLEAPATIGGNGVRLQIAPLSRPLLEKRGQQWSGGAAVRLSGPGVPTVAFSLPSLEIRSGADGSSGHAGLTLAAEFSFGGIRHATLWADGRGSWKAGHAAFTLNRCATFRAGSVEQNGKLLAERLLAGLCGVTGAPLVSFGHEGWDLRARLRTVSASLPGAMTKISDANGEAEWSSDGAHQTLRLRVGSAQVRDLRAQARYTPLRVSGDLKLVDQQAQGQFAVRSANARIGSVTVKGRLLKGSGQAFVRLGPVTFDPHHLQPRNLSPLLSSLRQASGSAAFTGRIAWSRHHVSSTGTLMLNGLDFLGPAGEVHDLRGQIHLISLLPPRTANDQTLTAGRVDATVPVEQLLAVFTLDDARLRLASAKARLGKGEAWLSPMTLSLAERTTTGGVLQIRNLDLEPLLQASNLASKVRARAAVSGAIPFRIGPSGIEFAAGQLASVDGGQLSIDPSLWSGNQGSAKDNAVRSLAYQALEHLKIESLEASVNSRAGGRLELVLHVKGRNDPPLPKPAEVDLFSLLNGSAFSHPIPLPPGTEVNLTLDITLNFAELLSAYQKAWAEALRPPAPTR